MIFGIRNAYEKYLERELERERNDNRILLSALLERAISREAAMMLRKPEELLHSNDALREKAKQHYEAKGKPASDPTIDFRHWRTTRGEAEAKSRAEAAAQPENINDSVERIEAKVKASQGA